MTLDPSSEIPAMWVFHKLVSIGKGYRWPIVAQKDYFDAYKTFEVPSVYSEWFDTPLETGGALDNIISIEIPEYIINDYLEKYPSQTDAYVSSFISSWPEIVDYLFEELSEIIKSQGKPIEGLILFKYYRCFELLAERLNIPTFYFELGLRVPDYRNTFYWSKSGLQGKAGFAERFTRFHKETVENPVLVLEAKEILALFLQEDKLNYLNVCMPKEYEFGILGGYSIPLPSTAFNQITLTEKLKLVRRWYSDDKIIIKKHPGDPLDASPRFQNIEKNEVTSAQFIQKCKRIVCAGSNTTFEAALYGVPAYDLGWSQYSFISNISLRELSDELPDKLKLSFVAFGCLAPLELLKDVDYIRKLIVLNSELEIYKLNLEYYLRDYGLTYEQLLNAENRLELILKSRLQKTDEYLEMIPRGSLTPLAEVQIELNNMHRRLAGLLKRDDENSQINGKLNKELECLKESNSRLNEELDALGKSNDELNTELVQLSERYKILEMKLRDMEQFGNERNALYHQILESTSYKCTKPLRILSDLLKIRK
jgi:hypothetical protein